MLNVTELMLSETVPEGTTLKVYYDEIHKWQQSINLISSYTLDQLWKRHFKDSIQLIPLIPNDAHSFIDLGSGAGFPGLVISLITGRHANLIESDRKKCVFLREVIRKCAANATCLNERIEGIHNKNTSLIISRALGELNTLFNYSNKLLNEDGVMIFLKGQNLNNEIAEAQKRWHFEYEIFQSEISKSGKIIKVWALHDKSNCDR